MKQQIRTTYAGLLERLLAGGYFDAQEAARVQLLLSHGRTPDRAQGAHDFLRRLVRTGRLALTAGALEEPAGAIAAADNRRGQIFRLPERGESASGALHLALDPMLGPPALLQRDEVWLLFQTLSNRMLASMGEAADLKAVVTAILDLFRTLLGFPTALCFTSGLPLPRGIARGPRDLILTRLGREPSADPSPSSVPVTTLPRAWSVWARRVHAAGESCLYLPDFRRLEEAVRPTDEGSAVFFPVRVEGARWTVVVGGYAPVPLWFHEERIARLRVLAPHFRRLLDYAVRLQSMVSYDFVTGIHNRAFFEEQLRRALADGQRKHRCFALLIADIDDFKRVNSRYGYDAGDEVLRTIARELQRALRTTDVLARYGGEEFAVVLSAELNATEAQQIGERLRTAVAESMTAVPTLSGGREQIRVTISIGGALFPTHGTDRDALWLRANQMLVLAKEEGKNRVRFPWSDPEQSGLRIVRDDPS